MTGKYFIIFCFLILCCSFNLILQKNDPVSKEEASHYMWSQLHRGNYDSIPKIIEKLTSALNGSPNDAALNARLGFIHLWKFCERDRIEHDTTIFRNVFISNYFFKKAIDLDPDDERIYSLQAATGMCEGAIRNNEIIKKLGYLKGLKAVPKWPQFNRFSIGAAVSVLDKNSLMFKEGLRFQWVTMDECSCKKLKKKDILENAEKVIADLFVELQKSIDPKIKRACWNTWIAPHNFEGYLLNFGDMLVKNGQLKEAKQLYSAIKLSPSYENWPYRHILEKRIVDLDKNEGEFNKPLELIISNRNKQIFINSGFSCMACHQMSKHEFETMKEL